MKPNTVSMENPGTRMKKITAGPSDPAAGVCICGSLYNGLIGGNDVVVMDQSFY